MKTLIYTLSFIYVIQVLAAAITIVLMDDDYIKTKKQFIKYFIPCFISLPYFLYKKYKSLA